MDVNLVIKGLSALAQPTRLAAFRLLVREELQGMPAGEVARRLGVPQNTMSAHLAVLGAAGLVRSERQSRSIRYRADVVGLREMTQFLLEDCCGGRSEICAPIAAALSPHVAP